MKYKRGGSVGLYYDGKSRRGTKGRVLLNLFFFILVEFVPWTATEKKVKMWCVLQSNGSWSDVWFWLKHKRILRLPKFGYGGWQKETDDECPTLMQSLFGLKGDWYALREWNGKDK